MKRLIAAVTGGQKPAPFLLTFSVVNTVEYRSFPSGKLTLLHWNRWRKLPLTSTGAGASPELHNPFSRYLESTTVLFYEICQFYTCHRYGEQLWGQQMTPGEEWSSGQGWAWRAAREGSCEGAFEREFETPGWGWPCWEQESGCPSRRWWSAEGLPLNNSSQVGFLWFRSWWYNSFAPV